VLTGIGMGAVLVVGCGHVAAPAQPQPVMGAVHIALSLDTTRVVAGQDLHGEATVTNTTSAPIMVQACPSDWLQIGLVNPQVPYQPLNSDVLCEPSIRLAPGPNRFPITIQTIYQQCSGSGCGPDGPPALPAGTYQTKVDTNGLPSVTPAMPVTVTVTA
jgi:hypothetical protein